MKKNLTRLMAMTLAVLMAVSLAACKGGDSETTTAAPDTTAAEPVETTAAPETTEAPVTEAPATEAPATEPPATEAPATEAPVTEATTTATTTAATTTAATTEATTAAKTAPTNKAEILKIYNDATAKVASQKPAFTKRRETKEGVYEAGLALKAFKGVVYEFMGIGAENVYNKTVAKKDADYSHYFLKSSLTTSDITDATCKLTSDGGYEITVKLKNGNSYTAGGSGDKYSASLDKSGISVGKGDKGYYDHKTAQNVYSAISEVAKGAVVDEKYTNATVKMTIDKDGNLQKMDVTFGLEFDISKVYGTSGHATGTTTVNFKDFKW